MGIDRVGFEMIWECAHAKLIEHTVKGQRFRRAIGDYIQTGLLTILAVQLSRIEPPCNPNW
jgi:hypothetical protein